MEQEVIRQIPTDNLLSLDASNNQVTTIIPRGIIDSARENKKKSTQFKSLEDSLTSKIEDQQLRLNDPLFTSQEEKLTATQEIKDLKKQLIEVQKQQASNNQLLETYNHRPLLEQSLKDAKNVVIIVLPWIRSNGCKTLEYT